MSPDARASTKLAVIVLMLAAVAHPAFACKGPTTIFADNFRTVDPAWHGNITIAGSRLNLTARAEKFGFAFYGGKVIDDADTCVDVIPPAPLKTGAFRGGLMFGFTDVANYYVFAATPSGQAVVFGLHNGEAVTPVSVRPSPALKSGANAINTLRVTWKGSAVSTFINDRPFGTFDLPAAFQNSFVGFYAGNGTPEPVIYQFANLKVTNVP